mmetsp:Transcript_95257/g.174561  ORF Transcript_95257/g.174561 Transcript_95257/m.174561 type:complete len:204 (-) Transcript_95257:293-904(-)
MPSKFRSLATRPIWSSISSCVVPAGNLNAAWKRMLSSAVSSPCNTSSCGTKPVTFCRNLKSSAGCPATSKVPLTRPYDARPLSTARRVDLPLPDGPITATRCPRPMARLMSCSKRDPSGRSKLTPLRRKDTPKRLDGSLLRSSLLALEACSALQAGAFPAIALLSNCLGSVCLHNGAVPASASLTLQLSPTSVFSVASGLFSW